jgi:NAD(P)-dependent dehydrogenase (short-subunit alcohol dehydrogenase family)
MGDDDSSRGVAVVSGAGSGLGRSIAVALARRGHPTALLGRREAPLRETLAEIEAHGGDGAVLPTDVRDAGAVEETVARIVERWGAPEVVVPAAGVAAVAPLDETSPETFRDLVDTNLLGVFHLLRAVLPSMKSEGRGRLVPVLSVAAREGFPAWGAYGASKWGLRGLVASLRAELAGSGILVTALYPGASDTPIWESPHMPSDWDRSSMVPADEVARLLVAALDGDPRALVEEIAVGPAGGAF